MKNEINARIQKYSVSSAAFGNEKMNEIKKSNFQIQSY
jgi:hypothetical protein